MKSFILSLLFVTIYSKSFSFFNSCPDSFIYLKYGNESTSLSSQTAILLTGTSVKITVSYTPVYYEIRDFNDSFIIPSSFNIVNSNINGLGYVEYPNVGCQQFLYAPTDPLLSTKSVIVYVAGALVDSDTYVGTTYQGHVLAQPNSYLQIANSVPTKYDGTYIRFCNSSCGSTTTGSASIPIGSAIFFYNYQTSPTSSTVKAAIVGSTTVSYWCDACDFYLDLDDDGVDVTLSTGAIIGIVIGCLAFCCICCGTIYCIRKKCCIGGDKTPLKADEITSRV